jgi:hypothetical protein
VRILPSRRPLRWPVETETKATGNASGSWVAPLPLDDPEFLLYGTHSPRQFEPGTTFRKDFFGYRNFLSSVGTLNVTVRTHSSVDAGYPLGSRLVVHAESSANRLGLTWTQKGTFGGEKVSLGRHDMPDKHKGFHPIRA